MLRYVVDEDVDVDVDVGEKELYSTIDTEKRWMASSSVYICRRSSPTCISAEILSRCYWYIRFEETAAFSAEVHKMCQTSDTSSRRIHVGQPQPQKLTTEGEECRNSSLLRRGMLTRPNMSML